MAQNFSVPMKVHIPYLPRLPDFSREISLKGAKEIRKNRKRGQNIAEYREQNRITAEKNGLSDRMANNDNEISPSINIVFESSILRMTMKATRTMYFKKNSVSENFLACFTKIKQMLSLMIELA